MGSGHRRHWTALAVIGLIPLVAAACGSPSLSPTPRPTAIGRSNAATTQVSPTARSSDSLCDQGQLLVGDLPAMDAASKAGIEAARDKAIQWQSDAVLTGLNVACELFEARFRWQATFYSRNAQAFFASDTGQVQPAGVEAADVPTLDVRTLSFALLHDTLSKAGYPDDALIDPSVGVEIRLNFPAARFGPPSAPSGALLFHVAISRLGEVTDVYVDARDGTAYWFGR